VLLVLKVVFFAMLAAAALVTAIVIVVHLHQLLQLLRFRSSMRSLAKDDADKHPSVLDVPVHKGTLEEEAQRQKAVWRLFYGAGLSVGKLHASRRLREAHAFVKPEWIQWQEWRGWQRLATEGSSAVRKRALDHARAHAEKHIETLPAHDLPLWLALHDEADHPALKLRWAERNINGHAKRAAIRVLEELATRSDATAAFALKKLVDHYAQYRTRDKALRYAKQYLAHPHGTMHEAVRTQLRQTFSPNLGELSQYGSRWGLSAPRTAHLTVRVYALDVRASHETWLDSPTAPLAQARCGDILWEKPLGSSKFPLFARTFHLFALPPLEGPIHIEVSAQWSVPALWSDCMGDEEMPIESTSHRLANTSLDAVLTLTESSVSTWVIDKKTQLPATNLPVTLMLRDAGGANIEAIESHTDDRGLFTWCGKNSWQFGVLVERKHDRGRKEQLFVTNASDVTTNKIPEPQRRFYVMLARPLYRPGERVQGKLFARQKEHEGSSKRLAAKAQYQLDVFGPRGTKLTTISCTLSEFGTTSFDFALPADAALGKYTFRVAHVYPAPRIEGSFHVEEFVAPEFRAELRAKDEPVWGRAYVLEFDANYFFGGPVANAEGSLHIKRSCWTYFGHDVLAKRFGQIKQLDSMSFKTDAQGKTKIDISWNGPMDPLRRFDGCDFDFVASVRDASGKSCEATLHVSVGRARVIVHAKPAKGLRLPGETLPLVLAWDPADPTDTAPRSVTLTCRKGWRTVTRVHEVRRSDEQLEMPLELPAGRWEISAHVQGQTPRARTKHVFTLLGPHFAQKSRQLVLSNDPDDSQGTIRVAITGPKTRESSELLVYNRGPRLFSKVIDRSSATTWLDLPFIPGKEEQVHFALWYFEPRDQQLYAKRATAEVRPPMFEKEANDKLTLAFPAAIVRPGAETSLEAKLDEAPRHATELTVTVVDEALFALVAPPKDPLAFFEESPPRPPSFAAWSVDSAHAQRGRVVYAHGALAEPYDMQLGSEGFAMSMQPVPSAPMAFAGPVPMERARAKSMNPVRAAAAMVAAPAALVAEAAGAVMRKPMAEGAGMEPQSSGAVAPSVDIQLRSDFSSEAAWIPHARFGRNGSLTLPISLPDTLTTWKASALLVSLGHDHLLEAHARVQTQKPLMVRLQAPRFFQERDVLALRAMLDSRTDRALSVETSLYVESFTLVANANRSLSIEPNGQTRVDVELVVPTSELRDVVVRAQAVATNADDVSDAEERRVPYRPYGVLLRKTFSGMLGDEPTCASFDLPDQRKKELTRLCVRIDRGPMDAILQALDFLREYPYGCVEQTCSRLLPHLTWQRVCPPNAAESTVYRSTSEKFPDDVVKKTLQRIADMQNSDGGLGWWPGGSSDVWMTAYVVFCYSMASQPDSQSLQSARGFLTRELLRRDHSDDADVFAAFALEWTGSSVSDRVIDVLSSRWENLSLSERAKLCWLLAARKHERAGELGDALKGALVDPAKRFLKKVARDDDDLEWFHPGSTEAIAFFVLARLRDAKLDDDLDVLVAFLLQHRKGTRWHNTRDTALAVFALLAYEEHVRSEQPERSAIVQVNAKAEHRVMLERLGQTPRSLEFGEEELHTGTNELSLSLDDSPSKAMVMHRYFSAELEVYTQESEIAATGEGIAIERSYWLLDEKKEPVRRLRSGDTVGVGERIRVQLKNKADKGRRYLLLEDMKLAGCEPVAKKSGRDVCRGHCAHVELRADRTAVFFDALGTDWHEVSYEVEAVLPGRFTAMPARIETMYEGRCFATSSSFALVVED